MDQGTILCWGDSNTYGYDPRGFLGGRYGPDSRWCDLLAEQTGQSVINCGENGRTTPRHRWEAQALLDELARSAPVSLLILMLGTNDVLMGERDSLYRAAAHLEVLVELVKESCPDVQLLLMAPPPVSLPQPELQESLTELGGLCRETARRQKILFCDPAPWQLSLAYDGIHLSPEGHRTFARRLAQFLSTL